MSEHLLPAQGEPILRGKLALEVLALDQAGMVPASGNCQGLCCGSWPFCFSDDE